MLHKEQIINEVTSDPIIQQLSPQATYIKDNSTDLWSDPERNYLFIHIDLIKFDNGDLLKCSLSCSNFSCFSDVLKRNDTLVFLSAEDENGTGIHKFWGVYKHADTHNNLSPDNTSIFLQLVHNDADVSFEAKQPNFRLKCIGCYNDEHYAVRDYYCSIEQNAKSMAYSEVKKMQLEDGEYYTELYRIWQDGSQHDVAGMPSIGLRVTHGQIDFITKNPFE